MILADCFNGHRSGLVVATDMGPECVGDLRRFNGHRSGLVVATALIGRKPTTIRVSTAIAAAL